MRRRLWRDATLVVGMVLLALAALEVGARILESPEDQPRDFLLPPVPKPANSFRVFMFGASSVRGNPVPEFGYVAQIEYWLRRSVPGREIEVHNFGFPGADTTHLLEWIRTAIDREPDLAYLHTGMGEFFLSDSAMRSRRLIAKASRLFALVRATRRLAAGLREQQPAARIGDPKDFEPYDRNSEVYKRKIDRYRSNVAAMIDVIRAAEVPLILSTVASNLSDWPPVNRSFSSALYAEGFDDTFTAIEAHLASGRIPEAKQLAERSLERYPGDAMLLFLLGKAYEASREYDRARELFYRARDRDPLPWRPVSETNDFIRSAASRDGVYLIDLERVLEEHAPNGLVGISLIADGAHPTLMGNAIIARAILEKMAENHLAISPEADYFSAELPLETFLRQLRRRRPVNLLKASFLNKTALFCLKYPLRHYHVARQHLERMLELQPSSWRAWANLATVSFFEGDVDRGMAELRKAIEFKGSPSALGGPTGAPYLTEAMQQAGIDLEALRGAG